MKLIEPNVAILNVPNLLAKIETAGRTCYKSEDKITEDSSREFVNKLIRSKHYAMLEHAEMTFEICTFPEDRDLAQLLDVPFIRHTAHYVNEHYTHYVTVSFSHLYNPRWEDLEYIMIFRDIVNGMYFNVPGKLLTSFVTNATTITPVLDLADELAYIPESEHQLFWDTHKSYTFEFTCDRGVSHELVRHRCSFAQESTRYCNYTKSKFGGEISFIKPAKYDNWTDEAKEEFNHQLSCAESSYMYLITEQGLTPQEARAVLPNALKTTIIMTAPVHQWKHFFDLRSKGITGAPHPDMKVVADMAYELFQQVECTPQN